MVENIPADYLAGLPEPQRAALGRVNAPGLAALTGYLSAGDAVAFLGAGVSRPLYPLWDGLIGELVDAGAGRLDDTEAATCRAMAAESPEEVVEIVRQQLGVAGYQEVLREVLKVRTDPESGRSWTPVQELICRCALKAVVTTNYDPGIVDARMRVRPDASATGFLTWRDELGLDGWRTGDVFGEIELPVLYAHGQHNQPDSIVLATTEYRHAYQGKLPHVLRRLVDGGHLVWIGFSFADQRIAAILREIANGSGTRIDPGPAPRHIAIMPWDPAAKGNDPRILARRAEIGFGAKLILYPAPGGDHAALGALLSGLTDERFPAAADLPARTGPPGPTEEDPAPGPPAIPVAWVPAPDPIGHFTGRVEELARLDRWAADPDVRLIGVTAWGGAGKTALVTHWVQDAGGATRRPGIRGVFGWSFYADPSAERWADGLLGWAERSLGVPVPAARRAAAVLALLRAAPLVLVLDGLEVVQEGTAGNGYGQFLDGTLREVLAGACQQLQSSLILLTSRFAFADLETFDGGSARMLDVPPFTPAEGAALLAAAGGDWLPDGERRMLVAAVDGHALAVAALAGLLADRPPSADLSALRADLAAAARTSARVQRVLRFYAERLGEPDRYLLAALAMFGRPVGAEAVLTVARHPAFGGRLDGWTPAMVETAARERLGGLVSWHPAGTVSAHPLVRDAFRSLALAAAEVAVETTLTGIPEGHVTSRADALLVVEAIELLLDAGQWRAADDLYDSRTRMTEKGDVWTNLPAARLGQRASSAFVETPGRRAAGEANLGPRDLGFYLAGVGLYAMNAGDLITAREYMPLAIGSVRDTGDSGNLSISFENLSECLEALGEINGAMAAATQSLSAAQIDGEWELVRNAHAAIGWLAAMMGDPAKTDEHFSAADRLNVANDPGGDHLYTLNGSRWTDWLARSGRTDAALALASRGLEIARENGWNADAAHFERLLGRLALAAGDSGKANQHLAEAAACFRDGDYLIELAVTLADQADHARAIGDLDAAHRHVAEAIGIAAPRRMVPAQSGALAVRARIYASEATGPDAGDHLARGRDAADAALRLATRHHLAWHEFAALTAHAALDEAEGIDHGWAAKARVLHARLVPPGLDPDPLGTVERLVAEQKAAADNESYDGSDA